VKKKLNLEQMRTIGLALIIFGVVIAIFGKVRTGSLLLAVGMGEYAYARYLIIGMKRRIELFVPLLIAVALFIVSLTLPHAG